jgi:hypothetical protein
LSKGIPFLIAGLHPPGMEGGAWHEAIQNFQRTALRRAQTQAPGDGNDLGFMII